MGLMRATTLPGRARGGAPDPPVACGFCVIRGRREGKGVASGLPGLGMHALPLASLSSPRRSSVPPLLCSSLVGSSSAPESSQSSGTIAKPPPVGIYGVTYQRYPIASYIQLPGVLAPFVQLPGLDHILLIGRPTADPSGGLREYRDVCPKSIRSAAPFIIVLDRPDAEYKDPKYRWCAGCHLVLAWGIWGFAGVGVLEGGVGAPAAWGARAPRLRHPRHARSRLQQPTCHRRRVSFPLAEVFKLDVSGFKTMDDYVKTLSKKGRWNFKDRQKKCAGVLGSAHRPAGWLGGCVGWGICAGNTPPLATLACPA